MCLRLLIWTETDQAAIFYVVCFAAAAWRRSVCSAVVCSAGLFAAGAPRFNVGRARAADDGPLRPYVSTLAAQHFFARPRELKIPTAGERQIKSGSGLRRSEPNEAVRNK